MKIIHHIIFGLGILLLASSCRSTGKISKDKNKQSEFVSEAKRLEFEASFYNGNKEKILGNNQEAARNFAGCLRISPKNPAASYELAMLMFKSGDVSNAEKLAATALEGDPNNEWYCLLYTEILMQQKKFKPALSLLEKLIVANPGNPENYLLKINCLLMSGDLKAAIKEYDRLEKMNGISEEISIQKERIYIKLQKFDLAVEELKKLIRSNPTEIRYHNLLAELYLANNKQDKALAVYEEARKIDPDNPYLHASLADFYRRNKNTKAYFEELKLVFKNRDYPTDNKIKSIAPYYTNLNSSDVELAAMVNELLDILVTTHPDDAAVFAVRGDFYLKEEKFEKAHEMYRRSAKIDKSNYSVFNQMMLIDSKLGNFENMILDAVNATELFPSQALPYLMGGMAYNQQKNYSKAISMLRTGIGYVVDNNLMLSQFYANLGDAYYQQKEYLRTDSCFDKALEINPEDTYVLNNYSYYLSLRKQKLEKAEKMSKKSNELDPGNPSYMDTYAWVLYAMQKYTDAKGWIERALEKDGNKNAVLLEHYGDILYRLDMKPQAFEYWKKAKEAGTGSEFLDKKIAEKKLIE